MVRFFAAALVAVAACSSAPDPTAAAEAQRACEMACRTTLGEGADLSKGPCLSDDKKDGAITPDFACDVAHSPREAIDDDAANQCQAFADGKVAHFVEVDPHCKFIRVE